MTVKLASVDDEPWDLSQLQDDWKAVNAGPARLADADRFNATENYVISARRVDESRPAGHQTYITAHQLITTALDHHQALLTLIGQPTTPLAPWTLLRAVFDASAWANWILDPIDGTERRRRGLRRTCLDFRERQLYNQATKRSLTKEQAAAAAQADATATAELQGLAAELLPWERARDKVNLFDELPKLATVQRTFPSVTDRERVQAMWRGMSGHAHGYSYAPRTSSTIRQSRVIPGGLELELTLDPNIFAVYAKTTALLLLSAIQLYVNLSRHPVAQR